MQYDLSTIISAFILLDLPALATLLIALKGKNLFFTWSKIGESR